MQDISPTRPDGDIELPGYDTEFSVPDCTVCGGLLKPDFVFFGDGVPLERAREYGTHDLVFSSITWLGTSYQ